MCLNSGSQQFDVGFIFLIVRIVSFNFISRVLAVDHLLFVDDVSKFAYVFCQVFPKYPVPGV